MFVSAPTSTSPTSAVNMLNVGATPVKAKTSTSTSSTSSSTDGLSSTTTGTTFLNLLVKELQNQDPTAPMDSTAMVGQMISLNQLDQLISINQTLTGATSSTSTSASGSAQASMNSQSSADLLAARTALMNAASPSSYVNSATAAASDPSTTLDFSSLTNQFGGK